ncbi:hypothetical protein A0H81_04919 [Grifola frondosa]|uniref:Reverse transcriptase domain-containing protein n=1 Tax=Grifola frondosa TaxID=5627 RepID=A0A1C7MG83_GRIFR|nr:hypothetical protein A0H81_04919 [Grifola frondosa]
MWMPFGLTGAPSTFAQLTATHLHDLLADNMLTLLVDDGAAAGDTFEEMMDKLHKILNRVRESKLSLSPSKTHLFMTEAVFAGANNASHEPKPSNVPDKNTWIMDTGDETPSNPRLDESILEAIKHCPNRHFDNKDIKEYCEKYSTKTHIVSAYSPWINGLVEDVGEDNCDMMNWDSLPKNWPTYLDNAIRALNYQILPVLKYLPKELLLSVVVNMKRTPVKHFTTTLMDADVAIQLMYVAQQRLDSYDVVIRHAIRWKNTFNKLYKSDIDYTFKTERKMIPKWSHPHCISSRVGNSYTLVTINRAPIAGIFHARRLCRFTPRPGMRLILDQAHYMTSLRTQQAEDATWEDTSTSPNL